MVSKGNGKILSNSHKSAIVLLRELETRYDRSYLATDPVYHVHQYKNKDDQEVVAFLSALFAFGNVTSIHQSLKKIFALLSPSPAESLRNKDYLQDISWVDTTKHRWVTGEDILELFKVLSGVLNEHLSLESYFLEHVKKGGEPVEDLLMSVTQDMKSRSQRRTRGFHFLFPSPAQGSPCKRLVLFLRWMIRPGDGIDLGLWKCLPASKLIVPLDTHVYRFARRYRLIRHKNPSWKMALAVTDFLRHHLDAQDPVRYDFSICHYGMEKGW